MELEGLRGVAAVIVACYHFSLAFYLLAYFGKDSAPAQHLGLESFLYANPLGGLISGTFAVAIFFVLSGFVLSIGFFQTGKSSIIKKLAVKRYLRLMLPALASVLLCYFLMKVGLSHTQSAANVTHSIWLSQSWWFAPHLRDAFSQAVGGIFMSGTERPYNNVLWTMYYEFTGSFIIFASLLMFGRAKHRWLLYAALSYTTFNTWIFGFVLGMVLADLYSMGLIREKVRKWFVTVPLLLVAIYLGGYPFGEHLQNTAYGWIEKIPYQGLNFQMMSTVVGASILITVVLTTVQVARGLRHKYISRLGKYSFSLYLVHLSVLYTFTLSIFMALHNIIGYNKAVIVAVIVSIPVVALMTVLFEKFVDRTSVAAASYWADIYFGKKTLGIRKYFIQIGQWANSTVQNVYARVVAAISAANTRGTEGEID